MNLYHNFGVDNDDDWDDYLFLFVVDDDNKKRKRIEKWEDDRIHWVWQKRRQRQPPQRQLVYTE